MMISAEEGCYITPTTRSPGRQAGQVFWNINSERADRGTKHSAQAYVG